MCLVAAPPRADREVGLAAVRQISRALVSAARKFQDNDEVRSLVLAAGTRDDGGLAEGEISGEGFTESEGTLAPSKQRKTCRFLVSNKTGQLVC